MPNDARSGEARGRIRAYFGRTIPKPVGDSDDIFDLGLVDSLFAMQLVAFGRADQATGGPPGVPGQAL